MTSSIPARFALIPIRLRHVPHDIELAAISGDAVAGPVSVRRRAVRSGHRWQRLPDTD